MAIFKKFRRSLRMEKNKGAESNSAEHNAPFCQSCGQRTPQRSTFSSFSSSGTGDERPPWTVYQRSESGHESFTTGSSSPTLASHSGDAFSMLSIVPPIRQATYSSSVYSPDNDTAPELFPPLPVMLEDDHDAFNLPPRTLTNYSENFKPKSRYARLNDLPVVSPRAAAFPDDLYDADAGIEKTGSDHIPAPRTKRRKWTGSKSLSVVILPSQLRRKSLGRKSTLESN